MKRIIENTLAIDFQMHDFTGKSISLSDYKGKKVLLGFFRQASCPFCNLRVRELINRYNALKESNIEVIAVFAASKEEIAMYAGKQQAPFPIIPDPHLDLYKKYSVEESHAGMFKVMLKPFQLIQVMFSGFFNLKTLHKRPIIPADFLINEQQKIYRSFYGKDFGDHIPLMDVVHWKK